MKCMYCVAACLSLLVISGLFLAPVAVSAPGEVGDGQVEVKELKLQLDAQQRALRDFKDLIETLADDRDDSSNIDRTDAIEELREAMKTYILRLEKKLGKTHHIIHHLEEPQEYDEEDSTFEDPTYSSGWMEGAIETGGSDRNPEVYRLARFQQIYITCQRVQTEAANGTDWAFNQYYKMTVQFAGLMNTEIKATRTQIESATSDANMSN